MLMTYGWRNIRRKMKTITEIKKNFSNEEIKLLVEIVNGKQDFEVMAEQIKDFYSDEYSEDDLTDKDDDYDWLRTDLLEKLEFDFFDELDKRNGMFGTGFTWNHFNPNHLQTRHDLFNWIKYYVDKYSVDVKNQQLKESLNGSIDNELFHTLKWNCGNCNVYNREMFNTETWKTYLQEFNDLAGGYRYRWGDCEVIGLYAYMHLDNPLIDFELRSKGLYEPQIPNTQMVFS